MALTLAVFASLVVAACFQRISGMGFSLVAMPALLWLIGPLDAVALVVLMSALTSLLMMIGTVREVLWKHVLVLGIPSVIIAFPTIYVLDRLPEPVVNLVVGGLLVLCIVTLIRPVELPTRNRRLTEMSVGTVAGFMNGAAGMSGPAISVYAFSAGWSMRSFTATAQPYFIVADIGVLAAKAASGGQHEAGALTAPLVLAAVIGCAIGLWAGRYPARWISDAAGRRIVIGISIVGAVATLVKAVGGLL